MMSFLRPSASPLKKVFRSVRSLAISLLIILVWPADAPSVSWAESESECSAAPALPAPAKYDRTSVLPFDFCLLAAIAQPTGSIVALGYRGSVCSIFNTVSLDFHHFNSISLPAGNGAASLHHHIQPAAHAPIFIYFNT
ncbi:hypothetical protein FKM82_015576 [Ascaphus truei]